MNTFSQTPAYPHWQQIGIGKHHGINIPVFSLHSTQSCGIGEFPDLLPLINWCVSIDFDIIQILPVNDTGHDPSPYNALSAFALNPILLGLSSLPHIKRYPELVDKIAEMQKLNNSQRIDYANVLKAKEKFLQLYFEKEGAAIISSKEFLVFLSLSPWLKGYALFKTLKERFNWKCWEEWPEEFKYPTKEKIDSLLELFTAEISWHSFVQYLCYEQLHAVKEQAVSKGISLMGDIPILISRDSADVWYNHDIFNLDYAAGAPPDYYNEEGQKWGFPLYNWDELKKQNYQWWEDRLKFAGHFYQMYRIDHVIGFFRIWAIPLDEKNAIHGKFIPEDRASWLGHGEEILKMMLERSEMLPVAEDLGDVPDEVRPCLARLGICSTKVMRWERMWHEDSRFIPPEDYPIISLTTISTHDSETEQLWWTNHPEEAEIFAKFRGWCYTHNLSREHLREILWESHHTSSLLHINLLQEYLALVPGMTWQKLEDERINYPGILSDKNWTYRFRPSVEEIVNNTTLSHFMRELAQ